MQEGLDAQNLLLGTAGDTSCRKYQRQVATWTKVEGNGGQVVDA